MSISENDIVRRVVGAEILHFPRAAAPAVAAVPKFDPASSDPRDGASDDDREDGGSSGGSGGRGDDEGGDDRDRELALLPLTDLGNAERFRVRFKGRLLYCAAIGWLAWDGKRWKRDADGRFVSQAQQETARAIQDEADALAASGDDLVVAEKTKSKDAIWLSDRVASWGRQSEAAARLAAISLLAASSMSVMVDELDSDPMAINVQNGTLIVRKVDDGDYITLRPHAPADLITKICPVEFDPKATCALWDGFLAQVQPKEENRRFLMTWFGLSLTGDVGEQKMTFHYGRGRNGKGVCINTMAFVAGDYADSIGIESFLDSGRARAGGQATPDLAGLPGVRTLTTSEPKKGATLDEGFVKLFTGGDPIKARHLNKDYFEFLPQAKLTMQGNYRPKISGTDEGIWGRMILVPWPVFIPAEGRDPHLGKKLQAEASGILNRMLDGLRYWLDHGLGVPGDVTEATAKYRSDSDPLGRFLDACTQPAIGQRVQASDMHALFSAWCKANGEAQWSPKGLNNALTERGMATKKSGNMFWLDVTLTKLVSDFVDAHGQPHHGSDGPDDASGHPHHPRNGREDAAADDE